MNLAHPQMETVLRIDGDSLTALVVEEPRFYRTFLCDLYDQLQGMPGELVLSEAGVTLPIAKWVELMDNCLHFELNRKSLLTRISAVLERQALSEGFFLRTSDLLCRLEAYMEDLAFSLPCDIVCEKCSASSLIKSMGIHIREEYEDPLERLLDYMELIREFDRDKLFVLVGLRSFFSDAALEAFGKTALDHGFRMLWLDCVDRKKLSRETRLTIDKDLCEF